MNGIIGIDIDIGWDQNCRQVVSDGNGNGKRMVLERFV